MARTLPPAGAPWDLPLEQAPLVFVDLEMSGLDLGRDRVLELAAVREQGRRVCAQLDTLVQPVPMVHGAEQIHGITEAQLAEAPSFAELWPRLWPLLDGAVFVAHSARWDLGFLQRELSLCGMPLPITHYLDTLTLSRRAFHFESHALASLAKELELGAGPQHRAMADVEVTRQLFWRCVDGLGVRTPRDLFGVRISERSIRHDVEQACVAACAAKTPLSVTYRPSGKKPETFDFMVLEVQREPSRVVGYEVASRARRELRGERIVSASLDGPPSPG